MARNEAIKLGWQVGHDPAAPGAGANGEAGPVGRAPENEHEERRVEEDESKHEKDSREISVSQHRRGPPASLRLNTEHDQGYELYRSLPRHQLPRVLKLDEHSRCRFGHRFDEISADSRSNLERSRSPFVIYTTHGVRKVKIETVKCTKCSRRRIGPDLLEHGLFNWNNKIGFTREVFDKYISELSLSQTTIDAFHRETIENYFLIPKAGEFCSESTFRRAFFAFLRIIGMESGMECKKCGIHPDIVICDGSVIAFERKRLKGDIRMPTLPTSDSIMKIAIRSFPLAAVSVETLGADRKIVEKIRSSAQGWTKDNKQQPPEDLVEGLLALGITQPDSFARAFSDFVAEIGTTNEHKKRSVLKELLSQLIAKHSMFFIAPVIAFEELAEFERTKTTTLALRRYIPILGKLNQFGQIRAVCRVFATLTKLARETFDRLVTNAQVEEPLSPALAELVRAREAAHPNREDPIQTGSFYGGRKLRSRNLYPGIKDDAGEKRLLSCAVKDTDDPQESCQKRFDLFGAQGLVGGICGTWCTHGICVGAHIMPSAEGRDDIFSALFCHWAKAPSHVIYDYSCQLALYAQRREPEFFKDTRFWIDELHAHGHTDCSSACYFSAAAREDPSLQHVNSSVAEGAHSTIGRIRKSVSYMNEEHAKLFLWVTIHAHNRRKLIDLKQCKRCPRVLEEQEASDYESD